MSDVPEKDEVLVDATEFGSIEIEVVPDTVEPAGAPDGTQDDDAVIYAGEVDYEERQITFRPEQHQAETARLLAYILVGILGGSVAIHYFLVAILVANDQQKATEELTTIFNAWLPAITGLVGAATTYYFTKETRKDSE